jgi:hypothetical protein
MPSAVTAIFSVDSKPFEQQLRRMEIMAAGAGGKIQSGISGPTAGEVHGGVVHSVVTLFREIGSGNWSRVPGSLTILMQRMGLLNLIFKDSASASKIVAEAYAQLAGQASLDAVALTKKAAASAIAFEWDAAETEATLNQAVADETAARAAQVNAVALHEKAVAAAESAAAQNAEAAASVGAIGIVTAVLIALTVGVYAAYKHTTALIEKLSGFKVPDFEPRYIPQHLKAVNQIAEEWKQINAEVQKAKENYNSVAKASERVADATKKHFDHLRRMNDFSISSSSVKAARGLEIDSEERNAQLANKVAAQANFTAEGNTAASRAAAINVPSKERDQNITERNKAMLDAANTAAKAIEKSKMEGTFGKNGRDIFRAYNAATDSGVSTTDLNASESQVFAARAQWKKAYENSVDRMAVNDETRKTKEELTKKSGESLSKAAQIGLEIPGLKKTNAQANADAAEESAAKSAEEKAKELKKGKDVGFGLNSQQRLGAYATTPPDWKIQTDLLRGILKNTMPDTSHNPVGSHSTQHGSVWHTVWRRQ